MAAILEPHRLPNPVPELRTAPRRPDLRVLPGGLLEQPEPERVELRLAVVVGVLALLAVLGALAVGRGALAGLAPAPPAASAVSGPSRTVVVEPGDAVWSIARRAQGGGDVRPLVDRIVAANGGTVLVPGQHLQIPA